jgi:hypothetical protein
MRCSGTVIRAMLALCAWGMALSSTAQDWRLVQQARGSGTTPFNTSGVGQPGIDRLVNVSETGPGEFRVMERTPFGNTGGANACVTRPRSGTLAMAGKRQVLTIAPAVPGCGKTRLVIEPDGSGWEEEEAGGQWTASGARLVGERQVASSRPVPSANIVATPTAPAVPPPAAAAAPVVAAAPAVASEPATPVVVAQASDDAPRRENPALARNGHRRALVIGNDTYRHTRKLLNARADARAMGLSLERAGFEVTTRVDVDARSLRASLREFKASLEPGDEAIVFYSGHGVQIGGINYLLPVDIRGESEDQLRDDAVPLQRVLDDASDKGARFMLAVIDACRDNPFKGSGNGRSLGAARGLAPTTAATGQMIIYSAGSGQQALDRLSSADKDPNGLFTRVFLRQMETPGVPIDRVLRNVRTEVVRAARAVGHEQTPALYDQTVGDFYLRPTH